jgi:hypothetical protein
MTVPRRYSANQHDFDPELGRRLRISLDGHIVSDVIEYDMDEGWVKFVPRDKEGNRQISDDTFVIRKAVGEVTVDEN